MKRSELKRLIPHAALIFGSLILVVGFFAFIRHEEALLRDTIRMQEVISIRQQLYRYYLSHAAYPSMFDGGDGTEYISLGKEGDAPCDSAKACPRYALRFTLETNLFFSKGAHVLTPEGAQ